MGMQLSGKRTATWPPNGGASSDKLTTTQQWNAQWLSREWTQKWMQKQNPTLCEFSLVSHTKRLWCLPFWGLKNFSFELAAILEFKILLLGTCQLGMATGRVRVSWSHPHPHNKNSSPSPNPTGIQLLTHPHPNRVTGIFLYPYPFFYCSIYQLNIFYKKNLKITPTESWYYQNIQY